MTIQMFNMNVRSIAANERLSFSQKVATAKMIATIERKNLLIEYGICPNCEGAITANGYCYSCKKDYPRERVYEYERTEPAIICGAMNKRGFVCRNPVKMHGQRCIRHKNISA